MVRWGPLDPVAGGESLAQDPSLGSRCAIFAVGANRDGQTERCTAYYLVADEGSDPVIADVLGIKDAQATGIVDPDAAGEPVLTGASEEHMKKLAAAVLVRAGMPVPQPPQRDERPTRSARRAQGELSL